MAKKTPSETFPLQLTELQRKSLIHCTRLKSRLKEKLENVGEGTQVVNVTQKELDQLEEEVSYAASYVRHPHKGRLVAVLRKVEELITEAGVNTSDEGEAKTSMTPPKEGDVVCQFKITLLDIKPPIWRRIQIPDCTLADLHDYIQGAFGWDDYHMHQFEISGECYGPSSSEEFGFAEGMFDEAEVHISDLIPMPGRRTRWIYEYDFGDGWRHEILFEGFLPADPEVEYPICVGGKRACPPEGCGGPWGYDEYVNAVTDPKPERHEELLEWGGPLDPEAFNAEEATKAMRGGE